MIVKVSTEIAEIDWNDALVVDLKLYIYSLKKDCQSGPMFLLIRMIVGGERTLFLEMVFDLCELLKYLDT